MNRSARCKAFAVLAVAAAALLFTGRASAEVRLAKIFGDGMILQRDMGVPVWGWAKSGEGVTVNFAGQEKSATADVSGKWRVRLDAMSASGSPREMIVVAQNTVTIKDVLVGEVWICGGQSNMEMEVRSCFNFGAERAAAANSAIRQIKVSHTRAGAPMEDLDASSGRWTACSPATVGQFTAAGYFFARRIAEEIKVPVGLINDNWGGTPIEPWIPVEGCRLEASEPEIKDLGRIADSWNPATEPGQQAYQQYLAQVKGWLPTAEAAVAAKRMPPAMPKAPGPAATGWSPAVLFDGMIAPVVPYAIRGALWYQGEANGSEYVTYIHKMKALIGGWRQVWGEGDFPFYFVQLAGWVEEGKSPPSWSLLREAQRMALAIPNTGMSVSTDLNDDPDNIHPKNKQDVGQRLALWELAKTYGKDIVYSGPLYKGRTIAGSKIRIAFDCVDGGLIIGEKNGLEPVKEIADGKLKWFEIAGQDKVWHPANAVIDGKTVVVSSGEVAAPVAVRYAFAMIPEGANLYNQAGLPASPFRTDDW